MRLATVAGIEIRVHASFLLLVGIVALGSTAPGSPGLVASMLWLVALFACVVFHELAHSLVARRNGIPIIEIELLPIGGVSKMARSPEDPAVELRIAAAGPAASLVLAAAAAAVALIAGVTLWPPTLVGGGFLARLAWVNLVLAAFNLLPALPLDGGRVLRAALEPRIGRVRATHIAATAGRVGAVLMIAVGVLVNVFLVVIGVFVYLGSWAEEATLALHERARDLCVRDVMIREPIVVPAAARVARAAPALWHDAQRAFPVVSPDGAYVGLVTAENLLGHSAETIGDVADRTAPTLGPDDPLEASGLLTDGPRVATVVSAGQVVGLARAADAVLVAQRRALEPAPPARPARPPAPPTAPFQRPPRGWTRGRRRR